MDSDVDALVTLQDNAAGFIKLDNAACLQAYSNDLITEWANVLVITHDAPFTNETLLNTKRIESDRSNAGSWTCNGPKGGSRICSSPEKADPNTWSQPVTLNPWVDDGIPDVTRYTSCNIRITSTLPVKYCLGQRVPEACQVGMLPGVLIAVLICNFIKIACLFWIARGMNFEPLVTIGDALLSFLQSPDSTTVDKGPFSTKMISNPGSGVVWTGKPLNGFHAASKRRWIFSSIL